MPCPQYSAHSAGRPGPSELRHLAEGLIVPYLGFIVPTMGTHRRETTSNVGAPSGVADALFPKTRQRVLAILFGNAGDSLHANAIIRLADAGTGGVQRELEALEHSGLLRAKRVGNQKHYQANRDAPVFEALRELVLRTSGLTDLLRAALTPMAERIQGAFVFGSVAAGVDRSASDIDLFVVSDDLAYAELFAALESCAQRLGRPVNPTLYTSDEVRRRVRARNAFVVRVLKQPKLWIVGNESDLAT